MTTQATQQATTWQPGQTIATGQDMKAARLAMGLTQTDMAGVLGVYQQSVDRVERGIRPVTASCAASMAMAWRLHELGGLQAIIPPRKKK